MPPVSPALRAFASRLLACEAHSALPGDAWQAAGDVCGRLRPQLGTLMGQAGFRALLARALDLAVAEVPVLSRVAVQLDGTLRTSPAPAVPDEAAAWTDAGVALVAHLLGLLIAFVGPSLTERLLEEVWPELARPDRNSFFPLPHE